MNNKRHPRNLLSGIIQFDRWIPAKSFAGMTVFLVLLISQVSYAQTETKVRALPDKITLGGETRLFIETLVPQGSSIEIPSREANLSPFEIKMVEELPSFEKNGRKAQKFEITLTAFQLGELTVPPVPLVYRDATGRKERVVTQSVKIKVVSVSKRPGDGKDIRPIKGPVSLAAGFLKNLLFAASALILASILCLKIYLRKRNQAVKDLEALKPPHERVELELGRLLKKNFIEEKKIKEFYSELADILRRYLERQLKIEALEATTAEIIQMLKGKGCDAGVIARVKNVLDNSDLVKFAKFIPAASLSEALIIDLRSIVESTKPSKEALEKGTHKK